MLVSVAKVDTAISTDSFILTRSLRLPVPLALGAQVVMVGRPDLWGLALTAKRALRGFLECFAISLSWRWRSLAVDRLPICAGVIS